MLKQTIKKHLINSRGPRLQAKIVVFESDDWGSIRIPNQNVREDLLSKLLVKSSDPFSKYDTLETSDDYNALYNVLNNFQDASGNYPLITANIVMNNPDFDRIAAGNFKKYYSESFLRTYATSTNCASAFETLRNGINGKLIVPQFHCNEHLNVIRWMKFLQDGNERYRYAFERKCFAIDEVSADNRRGNLMAAYDYQNHSELNYIKESIADGLQQFENIFGFKSKTTVAPCYVWDPIVEDVFNIYGVKTFQGSFVQNCPVEGEGFKKKYRFSGQLNRLEQKYLVRNCLFEPALSSKVDWVSKCMESIMIAFKWGKPAIIGTHRINFCSGMNQNQRDENLKLLEELLKQILIRWPEVQFSDSGSLSDYYYSSNI